MWSKECFRRGSKRAWRLLSKGDAEGDQRERKRNMVKEGQKRAKEGVKRGWERWKTGSSGGSQKKKAKRGHRVQRKAVKKVFKKVCEMLPKKSWEMGALGGL
jgi:hypothetical protein